MGIKKYVASKDNTITNAFKSNLSTRGIQSNMGASDILELNSIYGQSTTSSLEKTRILIEFPVDQIKSDRAKGVVPSSGSVDFYLRLFNAKHSYTVPSNFHVSVHPLLQNWSEGIGLDMESYSDEDASNWISCSFGQEWVTEGGTYIKNTNIVSDAIPTEVTAHFSSGLEDLEIDITPFVEEWIRDSEGLSSHATASITLSSNLSQDDTITLHASNGDYRQIQISTSSQISENVLFVNLEGSKEQTATAIKNQIASDGLFYANVDNDHANVIHVTQSLPGFYGNLKIDSSLTDPSAATFNDFSKGTGIKNRGLLLKLSGSLEDGTSQRSYYTKRFFARGTEFFFKRPTIEARSSNIIQDDRHRVQRSKETIPSELNINNIYLYNRVRGNLTDLPNTGSNLIVRFVDQVGNAGPDAQVVGASNIFGKTYVVASKVDTGIYKAQLEYAGTGSSLTDIWCRDNTVGSNAGERFTHLATGSSFLILDDSWDTTSTYGEFTYNISNLKQSYSEKDSVRLRVHTRDKKRFPNIYTKATTSAPTHTITESYYKITRVFDNYVAIPYSTGSGQQFSRLSYDVSGSFFDLDMSILEPNYLYQVSFVRKQDSKFIEQKEKFRFRVEK